MISLKKRKENRYIVMLMNNFYNFELCTTDAHTIAEKNRLNLWLLFFFSYTVFLVYK